MLLLQSVAELSACSQLGVLSLAQNQLTTLDGLEGAPPNSPLVQSMQLSPSCTSSSLVSLSAGIWVVCIFYTVHSQGSVSDRPP